MSRGTPMISPLIKWEHSEDWYVTKFDIDGSNQSGERKVQINLSDPDFEYIEGHTIDGNLHNYIYNICILINKLKY